MLNDVWLEIGNLYVAGQEDLWEADSYCGLEVDSCFLWMVGDNLLVVEVQWNKM